MNGILLAATLLAFGSSGSLTEAFGDDVSIARADSSTKYCNVSAFAAAAIALEPFLSTTEDLSTELAIYRSPANQLRYEADRMDARDAAVVAFRAELIACGWMAEPGAFDRKAEAP